MKELADHKCEACKIGAPLVSEQEKTIYMSELNGWEVKKNNNIDELTKSYKFNDFEEALSFTNRVGNLSDNVGHHPVILTEWGKVTLRWWTHKIGGLHKNDFVMAAKSDRLQHQKRKVA